MTEICKKNMKIEIDRCKEMEIGLHMKKCGRILVDRKRSMWIFIHCFPLIGNIPVDSL